MIKLVWTTGLAFALGDCRERDEFYDSHPLSDLECGGLKRPVVGAVPKSGIVGAIHESPWSNPIGHLKGGS
ncbi:MAG TPA: hypothetical protein VM163_01205 [bacterium]|nr:hypothetical protein [bacterium]